MPMDDHDRLDRNSDLDRTDDLDGYVPPDHRQLMASTPSFFIPPPYGWRHPVTGRLRWQPDPHLLAFGQYVKRSRYLARMTQRQLSDESGVDQGQISRLERALAPSMRVDRVVKLSGTLGRSFPLGYCPHQHWCHWQPAPSTPKSDPLDQLSDADKAKYLEILLGRES
jgi:transcriptional regulator with XRE-family HTH domain